MAQPGSSGDIEAGRDMYAHTINTGFIENRVELNINVIQARLDQLAELLARPEGRVCFTAEGRLEATAGGQASLPLPGNLLEAFQLLPQAADAGIDLRRRAYAAWLFTRQPRVPQERAARQHYIPLAGRLDLQDIPLTLQFTERRWVGQGPQRQVERVRLTDVTEAIDQHPAFVLLGPPGCGKTTVLGRLALDTARAFLTGQDVRLPLRLNLANYTWPHRTPLEFVSHRWSTERLPGHFVDLVRTGQVLLLADGLNEMERLDTESQRARRANVWKDFITKYFADEANHSRLVLTSRDQADYDQPLDLPRVEIDPLTETQIEAFLTAYLGEQAGAALAVLRRLALLEHAHNPYQLSVLAALYAREGRELPSKRGALFAQYAYWLVEREKAVGHPHWIRPEAQLAALSHLGYQMQARSESTVLPADQLQALLPPAVRLGRETVPVNPVHLFDLACRAAILIPDPAVTTPEAHKFSHQLLQEQFAAQHLLTRWQAGDDLSELWLIPLAHQEMPPANVGQWDPLPPPPPTGWEQTTILAAGITHRPDAFVRAVLAANPALAGRCLSEGGAVVQPDTRTAVQQALLAHLGDPSLHRRARLQAGRVLAAVGDPRFLPVVLNKVEVILPDLVPIPGGTATLGSLDPEAYDDERPQHKTEVASFYLARYPVTNAEYGCFIQAGGYDTERYWTSTGWQWRQGELAASGPVEEILEIRQYFLQYPAEIEKSLKEERITPDYADTLRALIQLSEDEVRQQLAKTYSPRPHEHPYYWDDPAYNASNQPVVGVTWYEAMAYCAWLGEQLAVSRQPLAVGGQNIVDLLAGGGWQVRLPAEAEWEWAAGGAKHTAYPWGSRFEPDKANTLEGRILGTTPVGAYPAGAAACGALDMSGNVWEWTHSLYQAYPYRSDDGREEPLAEGRRTLRGGAWSSGERNARVSARIGDYSPDSFDYIFGCRVVVAPVP